VAYYDVIKLCDVNCYNRITAELSYDKYYSEKLRKKQFKIF